LEINDIKNLRISLASPEQIHAWSYGEVTKPETINYRRLRPEKDGLFCEAIFGPTKDWQCYCGKYKKVRFRGIVCDKCGVEVTHSRVRRERMGHIDLATPIAHIWYTRRSPSYLGLLLNISQRNLDRVLYYAQYIITEVDEPARDRALKRLEDDLAREIGRYTEQVQQGIGKIDTALSTQDKQGEEREATIVEDIRARRDQAIERVMSQATALRESLERQLDLAAEQDLEFVPTHTLLVSKGDIITREHRLTHNQLVDGELTRIEQEYSAESDLALAPLERELGVARAKAETRRTQYNDTLETKLEEIRLKFEDERDQLMALRPKQLISEVQFRDLTDKWGRAFKAAMGAEAIYTISTQIDLATLAEELKEEIGSTHSKQRKKKAVSRLQITEALLRSGRWPEWMILTVLPVIPPALRPMVQLDGGRFATSDLNDLYRRVVNRNNRLKHLMSLQAPEVIIRNEKRMLQEAVDSLIDNSRRGKAISLRGRRQLKSLSDMLKGKQGRFRRNLLGKRVDYSGRSVIVVGPDLKLFQCGLPKRMALELFRPFVMNKLVEYSHAINVKGAKRLIERETPEVWEVLEEVIKTRPVLLNRAPTLHRLGIQAFEPILVEGSAIHLHPLVCSAFNADFDGDQMAVHLPLSEPAVREARELMLSSHNLLRPANGEPEVGPSKDMVLGCYYLTMNEAGVKGEGMVFGTADEVDLAYSLNIVNLHAAIKFMRRDNGSSQLIDTTVGRVLFNAALPDTVPFVNRVLDKNGLKEVVAECYERLGVEGTGEVVDLIKDIGFKYAMRSGTTIAIDDIHVPEKKAEILDRVNEQVTEVERQYRRGLITDSERYMMTVDLWTAATDEVTDAVSDGLDPNSSLGIMVNSGSSKGGMTPIRQLAGMRGLMADPSGRIMSLPIRSNFREGLTSLEYFISTHGSRKGLADTALRTADAGYLTRRLVDVAQDVIINSEDCGTTQGIWIDRAISKDAGETVGERIVGRYSAAQIVDPVTGEIILGANEFIDKDTAHRVETSTHIRPKVRIIDPQTGEHVADKGKIVDDRATMDHITRIMKAKETPELAAEVHNIDRVYVRSALTCSMRHGMCQHCYGQDLARNELVKLGAAVGIVAAQSIGEPGTQLTLRTFHTGGVAGAGDITQGLPRIQELFEARIPRGEAIIADMSGRVSLRVDGDRRWVHISDSTTRRASHSVPAGFEVVVTDGDHVERGQAMALVEGGEPLTAKASGRVSVDSDRIVITHEETRQREYDIPPTARLRVSEGDDIVAGAQITEGVNNPHEILKIMGLESVREYLVLEIQKVYRSQGVTINDKHIEVVVRQMMRRVNVMESGDTGFLPGELVDRFDFEQANQEAVEAGNEPGQGEPVVLGITKAALNTESFLSAASFQHTISVLAESAVQGRVDDLRGLKESVLIGKLIPAGTGFRTAAEIAAEEAEMAAGDKFEPLGADVLGDMSDGLLGIDQDGELDALDAAFRAKGGGVTPRLPMPDALAES
jgi:DNA-directed RNA polymerase subunit beta'